MGDIEINKIYCENCLDTMGRMPDGFIDLTVTSPPYDNLRTYNGYEFDFEAIAKELYRVTKDGGVVVWVVGDATVNGSETGTSFRQALYFKDVCGFNLHDTMIYAKKNPIPQNHNRYEQQFEFMFVFSKKRPFVFNPIKMATKTPWKKYSWNCKNDYGDNSSKRNRNEITTTKKEKNLYNIWYTNVSSSTYTNSAPFPKEIVVDHILSWSNENDLVYDPMMGSGTTAKAALMTNRQYIGSEISQEYVDIAEKRIHNYTQQLRFF